MKKLLILIITLTLIGSISKGQDTMYVHQNGGVITKFAVTDIDSILFYPTTIPSEKTLKGYAQKGPFINGSSISVYELQPNLSPTGKSFNDQIIDNKGSFEFYNLALSSNYVNLRADGFYFNEVSGEQSTSQITLNAVADLSGKSNVNVNLLTHLEKSRVEYLMRNGKSFIESKIQAQQEILAIFNIQKNDSLFSEAFNISENGADNGILLAISSILQGYRSESELTELLSNISSDIKEDGILNSILLGSDLINHAVYLDTTSIKNNLVNRYNNIGASVTIPEFGKYISNFISQTNFQISSSLITFPKKGIYGDNILSLKDSVFMQGNNPSNQTHFSLAAQTTKGIPLTIKITALSLAYDSSSFGIALGTDINWIVTSSDIQPDTYHSMTFKTIETGKSCDGMILFFSKAKFLVEYYEMNAIYPTRKKIITLK